MEEIFKTIQDYPDYKISNMGRVISSSRKVRYTHHKTKEVHYRITEEKLLKVHLNNRTGYKFVQLYKDGRSKNMTIHRLVALAFIPNKAGLSTVNHIDGNKHNNVVSNLEWCTNDYNHKHATETGLKAKGSMIGSSRLNEQSVYAIKFLINKRLSHSLLAKAFGVSRSNISHIKSGAIWAHVAITGEELTIKENKL